MKDENNENQTAENKSKGILITEGAELTVNLTMSASANGPNITFGSDATSFLRQDLCRHWLRIALEHCLTAKQANLNLKLANDEDNSDELSAALREEFTSSMQAIMASEISLDSFYSSVKSRISIPEDQRNAWRQKRTPRWKQIAEVYRLGCGLKNCSMNGVRDGLQTIYRFRDYAVHPPANMEKPIFHPDIERGVEWRFVAFRYSNACEAVHFTIDFLSRMSASPNSNFDSLKTYCENLEPAINNSAEIWNNNFPDQPIESRNRD
ncbi:MAG: hypothetical protein AAGA40_13050 [Cyanobacteria bacterium P01_E01_bin.45]